MDQSFELQTEGAQVAAAQDVEGHADIETTSGESGVANSAQGPPPSTEVPSTGLAAHGGHPESLVNAADHRDATAEGFELSPPMTHNRRIPIQLKPRIKISVSANQEHHLRAALSLSAHLDEFRIPHAYIGGFAWALLGSSRPTQICPPHSLLWVYACVDMRAFR
ncbi:hypothetical protein GY45DRAFT_1325235 [Cubamyces sp. BRFM 1775]|nr:hypothetical protein GY45DRAFT_1325235 [Cubamyces sp. BRFM 1775]